MIQEISKLCSHLFRENICYETLQLLPALNRWALLRLMIVKYELYDVSEQPTAMLLQHTQCWHLFIYCQSALKAALTSKSGACTSVPALVTRIGNLWTLSLNGCDYNKTDNLFGPEWPMVMDGKGSSWVSKQLCVLGVGDLPPPIPDTCLCSRACLHCSPWLVTQRRSEGREPCSLL